MSRRKFLGQASCALVGSATFLNSYFNLGMMNALAKPAMSSPLMPLTGDYKATVCILLAGGNDSYNMLVPSTTEIYNNYAASRSNLALPQGSLLPLNFTDGDGYSYGLHPSMPELQGLFNTGKAAFISNVGTLRQPTTKQQVIDGTALLPLGLLSHSDQIQQWQTSLPQERTSKGWGGRMADILHTLNDNQDVSMSISLSGVNTFQTGNEIIEFAIENSGNGSVGINIFEEEDPFNQLLGNTAQSVLEQEYQDIFKQTYRDKVLNAQGSHEAFSSAIAGVSEFVTQFNPQNPISQNMQMIAKSIAASSVLGHTRQTYFLTFGGWDHHDEVLENQQAMLALVSQALGEFQAAMEEINMDDCVTTFTISDFARTLTSNGNGTDHAWGGNAIVMGGAVNGGQIYGQYPNLGLGSDQEVGNGIILPTTSADEYFAELALWMGVEPGDMEYILPNLGEFFDINNGQPIGFMNI
ncbi:DUF1501 domain-containing protein [Sanyastnella coralliicola]|uniref:DUF1501 domain-containing protein n=1 Tax=Sanyastnella coralliicola TaxID=3069118 RepID=UPI0027B8CE87|nr:DUF1501 domain-containing protein [Longitalea sp. SCSIO 12813]